MNEEYLKWVACDVGRYCTHGKFLHESKCEVWWRAKHCADAEMKSLLKIGAACGRFFHTKACFILDMFTSESSSSLQTVDLARHAVRIQRLNVKPTNAGTESLPKRSRILRGVRGFTCTIFVTLAVTDHLFEVAYCVVSECSFLLLIFCSLCRAHRCYRQSVMANCTYAECAGVSEMSLGVGKGDYPLLL